MTNEPSKPTTDVANSWTRRFSLTGAILATPHLVVWVKTKQHIVDQALLERCLKVEKALAAEHYPFWQRGDDSTCVIPVDLALLDDFIDELVDRGCPLPFPLTKDSPKHAAAKRCSDLLKTGFSKKPRSSLPAEAERRFENAVVTIGQAMRDSGAEISDGFVSCVVAAHEQVVKPRRRNVAIQEVTELLFRHVSEHQYVSEGRARLEWVGWILICAGIDEPPRDHKPDAVYDRMRKRERRWSVAKIGATTARDKS